MNPNSLSLQQEATNETTSPRRLYQLAKTNIDLARLVALNPSASSELLRVLANGSDQATRQHVAVNPNTPTEVLKQLGDDFPKEVSRNPALPLLLLENPNIFNEIFKPQTLWSLVLDAKTPAEVLELLVIDLDLKGKQLTGIPAEFCKLTKLKRLSLSGNQLTVISPIIGQLTSLTKLDIRSNQLTTLPAEIGQLTNLTELDLRDNKLTVLPAEIAQLTNLTKLSLGGNQLTCLPAEIGDLIYLRQLDLSSN